MNRCIICDRTLNSEDPHWLRGNQSIHLFCADALVNCILDMRSQGGGYVSDVLDLLVKVTREKMERERLAAL